MGIQRALGSDIAMVFHEYPPHDAPARDQLHALERTIHWAHECREQPRADGQKIFGIVQGGSIPRCAKNARKLSSKMEFDCYAIGGLSVDEPLSHLRSPPAAL
jgi:queuine tRNA-ribosyltransferase